MSPTGLLILGVAAGVMSVVLGIGGGLIMVPALVLFAALDPKVATAVSLVVIVPTAISGGLQQYLRGYISPDGLRMSALIALGAIPASFLGSWLKDQMDSLLLVRLFGALMLALGIKALWTGKF